MVVCAFFGIAFLSDWNENLFSSPAATSEFSKFAGILSAALSQLHVLGFCRSARVPSSPLALCIIMFPKAYVTSHSRCLALDE